MTPDKVNVKAMRELFREAFELLGGANWLVQFASSNDGNARVFVQALSKLIPQELTGKDGQPLTIVIRKEGGEEVPVGEIVSEQEGTRVLN
jgi:hypothetical protein